MLPIHQTMKKYIKLLTVITNLFIIAGVTRHWIRYDNTKLAAPQPQAAQVQEQAPNGASCPQAY
jgi:hypothetical protein